MAGDPDGAFEWATDLLAKRYGYTDAHILSMPYVRLKQAIRVAAEREAEEAREKWRLAAFTGYLISAPQRTKPVSFAQFLREIGMESAPGSVSRAPSEDMAVVKERALAIGASIRDRDPSRRRNEYVGR